MTTAAGPESHEAPGTHLSVVPAPNVASELIPMPQAPGGLAPGRWVWVDDSQTWAGQRQVAELGALAASPDFWWAMRRPRTWAGLDLPVTRDPIFWVWAFFMTATTVTSIWFQPDSDKIVSILVVSWACSTAVYWFVPALVRQLWRRHRARKRNDVELTVTQHHD
jgi:hypothetical protein